MLDSKGFDQWAGEYDESIEKYSNGYPFEGYYNVLEYISMDDAEKVDFILDLKNILN